MAAKSQSLPVVSKLSEVMAWVSCVKLWHSFGSRDLHSVLWSAKILMLSAWSGSRADCSLRERGIAPARDSGAAIFGPPVLPRTGVGGSVGLAILMSDTVLFAAHVSARVVQAWARTGPTQRLHPSSLPFGAESPSWGLATSLIQRDVAIVARTRSALRCPGPAVGSRSEAKSWIPLVPAMGVSVGIVRMIAGRAVPLL